MKVYYVPAKLKDLALTLKDSDLDILPKKLMLLYTIQYKDLIGPISLLLKKNNIKVTKTSQVLGCSEIKTKESVLLLGTGEFHTLNLYLQSPNVFISDGIKLKKVSKLEIKKLENHRTTALLKFLAADNIGILVSTKPGQENLKLAIKISEGLIKNKKTPYIFLSNNIDINSFENYNIDSWINTACLGLSYDNPDIINYKEISKYIK